MLKIPHVNVIIIIALSISLTQCVSTPTTNNSNRNDTLESQLKRRIEAFYKAELTSDWYTYYQMMSPEIKAEVSFQEFKNKAERQVAKRNSKLISWRILSIKFHDEDNITHADVLMDVIVEHPDGKQEKVENQTDYWVFYEGKWYWSWRGWPHD